MGRPRIPLRGPFAIALSILGLATAYFVAGKFGLSLALVNTSTTAVWPPTGIALAALLLLGLRVWPGIRDRRLSGQHDDDRRSSVVSWHRPWQYARSDHRRAPREYVRERLARLRASPERAQVCAPRRGTRHDRECNDRDDLACPRRSRSYWEPWRDLVHLVARRREWRHRHRTRSPDLDPLGHPRAELAADRAGRIAGGGHPDRSSPVRRGRAAFR